MKSKKILFAAGIFLASIVLISIGISALGSTPSNYFVPITAHPIAATLTAISTGSTNTGQAAITNLLFGTAQLINFATRLPAAKFYLVSPVVNLQSVFGILNKAAPFLSILLLVGLIAAAPKIRRTYFFEKDYGPGGANLTGA